MKLLRIWKKLVLEDCAEAKPWIQWDNGSTVWELRNGELRHFKVCQRESLPSGEIQEVLELLPEALVPLECLARHVVEGWEVGERPMAVAVASAPSAQQQQQQKQRSSTALSTPKACEGQSHPAKQIQEASASQEESSQQPFYTLPKELWAPLAEWIPSTSLYQPSLRPQAIEEWSDTPMTTSVSPKVQGNDVRPVLNGRLSRAQGSHSRIGQPKKSGHGEQAGGQSRRIQMDRPLFV